jgi:hypothetical protein
VVVVVLGLPLSLSSCSREVSKARQRLLGILWALLSGSSVTADDAAGVAGLPM